MNHTNGRLILKVKKRRNTFPVSKVINTEKQNSNILTQRGLKRSNPFSKCNNNPAAKSKLSNIKFEQVKESEQESEFLYGLEKCDRETKELKSINVRDISSDFLQEHNMRSQIKEDSKDVAPWMETASSQGEKQTQKIFPLDWSLKHKIRFFSTTPFKITSIKAPEECKGIFHFANNSTDSTPNICQSLYNWVHPSLPGIANYPLKTKVTGSLSSDDKVSNPLANNLPLQKLVMKQWRISFQSLFNMLKTEHCAYFYVCTYQFTILFKAAGIGVKTMSAVMGPTTKGLRDMLTEEGISFEFIHNTKSKTSTKEVEFGFEEEEEEEEKEVEECDGKDEKNGEGVVPNLNVSYEEDFLDSIGLTKREHFPSIEAQQRLAMKSELRFVDNRPESTIRVKNCQGLFNFLLNANFLRAPSGIMTGVPPTIISPSPFEGGTLSKCKINIGPMKQQKKSASQTMFCIDVNGVLLPGQIKGLVDVITMSQTSSTVRIQVKTFGMIQSLNGGNSNVENIEDEVIPSSSNCLGVSSNMLSFLNQKPVPLSNNTEVVFTDNHFEF